MPDFPNWFAPYAEALFHEHLTPLAGEPGLRFLQLGAFTGDASVWLLSNVLTGPSSVLVDVDTWAGSSDEDAHAALNFAQVEATYDAKVKPFADSLVKVKATTRSYLKRLPANELFDFVYVDADHQALHVLRDGLFGFAHLKPGGLIAFDDYLWASPLGDAHSPMAGVKAFEDLCGPQVEPLVKHSQAWFRKAVTS